MSTIHDDDIIRLTDLFDIMCYGNDRYIAFLMNFLNQLVNFRFSLRIQHTGGFIKNKNLRRHGKNTGNRHTLLLPAGQLGRFTLHIFRHFYLLCKTFNNRLHFFRFHLMIFQTKRDIIRNGSADKLIVRILKDDSDLIANIVQGVYAQLILIHINMSLILIQQTDQQLSNR